MIAVRYLPKVIDWSCSELNSKISSCPAVSVSTRFHGDLGDWTSASGWQAVSLIAAEICRSGLHYVNSELDRSSEGLARPLLSQLEEALTQVADLNPSVITDDHPSIRRASEASIALIREELCYADDDCATWAQLLSEWSYGASEVQNPAIDGS